MRICNGTFFAVIGPDSVYARSEERWGAFLCVAMYDVDIVVVGSVLPNRGFCKDM